VKPAGREKCAYRADCGALCGTKETMKKNRTVALDAERELGAKGKVGMNGWTPFPSAANRVEIVQ
jgi:hypothetical protein